MGPTWLNLGRRCAPDGVTLLHIGPTKANIGERETEREREGERERGREGETETETGEGNRERGRGKAKERERERDGSRDIGSRVEEAQAGLSSRTRRALVLPLGRSL